MYQTPTYPDIEYNNVLWFETEKIIHVIQSDDSTQNKSLSSKNLSFKDKIFYYINLFYGKLINNINYITCANKNHTLYHDDFDGLVTNTDIENNDIDNLFRDGFIKREWDITPFFDETNIIPSSINCRLCYEYSNNNVKLGCNHSFCDICIYKYINSFGPMIQPVCPICRKEIISLYVNSFDSYKKYTSMFNQI